MRENGAWGAILAGGRWSGVMSLERRVARNGAARGCHIAVVGARGLRIFGYTDQINSSCARTI